MTIVRPTFRPAVAFAAASALFLSACGGQPEASAPEQAKSAETAPTELTVAKASLRLNPNAAAPSAAYFTLSGGASDDALTAVSSPDAARAEMHESKMEGGLMTMAPIASIPVAAGATVEFRQGGKHIMLFDINETARTAGKVKLVLTFASGATLETEAVVAPASDDAGAHAGAMMDHEGH